MHGQDNTSHRLKQVIIESLNLEGLTPEDIEDSAPLFGDEGLGLDSVDALELMVALEKEYGVKIEGGEMDPEAFASVNAMAAFVETLQAEAAGDASA